MVEGGIPSPFPPGLATLCSTVLPDGAHDAGPMSVDDAEKVALRRSKLQKFIADKADAEKKTKADKPEERVHNQWYMNGIDLALNGGTGLGLALFKLSSPVAPLTKYERRWYLKPGDPSEGLKPRDDPPGRSRSCILDLRTGKSRFELECSLDQDGMPYRPAFHVACGKYFEAFAIYLLQFGKETQQRVAKQGVYTSSVFLMVCEFRERPTLAERFSGAAASRKQKHHDPETFMALLS